MIFLYLFGGLGIYWLLLEIRNIRQREKLAKELEDDPWNLLVYQGEVYKRILSVSQYKKLKKEMKDKSNHMRKGE